MLFVVLLSGDVRACAHRVIRSQCGSVCLGVTGSCVRIVNGVDKQETESMPTAKEEDTRSLQKHWHLFLFLFVNEDG